MFKICSFSHKTCKLNTKCLQDAFRGCVRIYSSRGAKVPPTTSATILAKPNDVARSRTEFITLEPSQVPNIITDSKRKAKKIEETWKELQVELGQIPKHYLMLGKFRLTTLVVTTSMAGYALSGAPLDMTSFLACSVGTGLVSAAANSINQFLEVPFDAQMSRTKNRVLVRGHLTPLHAVGYALTASSLGLSILYLGTNGLTAALGAANLVLYSFIYTPMKRVSILNTWVGSVVGALPPVMGYVACEGSVGAGAGIMAGILYAWQFPHFNALSWNLRPDYSRAGYRMMAVTNPGLCRRVALRYTVALCALSVAAPALDVTTWVFPALSLPLNAYFTYLAYNFYKESDSATSRKLFRFSLLHLPILMALLLITKKHWGVDVPVDTKASHPLQSPVLS